MHPNRKQQNETYSYGFFSKNRGLLISIFLIVSSLVFNVTLGSNDVIGSGVKATLLFLSPSLLFMLIHVFWDFKIKKNHMEIELRKNSIVFFNRYNTYELFFNNILRVDVFPTSENIYDEDYVDNMLSSGVRFVTKSGDKFLIFT